MDQVLDFSIKKRPNLTPSPTKEDSCRQPSPSSTTGMFPTSPMFQVTAADLLRRAMIDPMTMTTIAPSSPTSIFGSTDPSLLPTTSLALSALHRRRRRVNTETADSSLPSPKKPKTIPDTDKDDAYWERRRKNNDAAKRSRDSRKMKEDEIAVRAALLEQDNLKLKAQVNVLKNEMARLHCLLFNQVQIS